MNLDRSDEIEFASATEADLIELNQLVNSAYRGESSKAGWTTEADLLGGQRIDVAALRTLMSDPKGEILLAFKKNAQKSIVGCVHLKKLSATEAYLGMLTVKPTLQGAGLGKKLLQASEAWARRQKANTLQMTVIAQRTELIAWYERHGYKNTQEVEKFPSEDKRFGIPRRNDLFFYVFKKRITL